MSRKGAGPRAKQRAAIPASVPLSAAPSKSKRQREEPENERDSTPLPAANGPDSDEAEILTHLPAATTDDAVDSVDSFKELGLSAWLVDTCRQMGLKKPTDIQIRCIPRIMKGGDVIGRAKTGSGKTAAFALPMLDKLGSDPFGIFGLVLTPTRELAFQIAEQFRAFGVPIGLKVAVVVGGLDMMTQAQELAARPHIVIATPGRLCDHIKSGTDVFTDHLQFLVFDEADRLFEPCFAEPLQVILEHLPPPQDRQTLLFSATLTRNLARLQATTMTAPVYCDSSRSAYSTVDELKQQYLFVPQIMKECYLAYVLKQPQWAESSVIVFTSTCKGCSLISQFLTELEVKNVSLHSQKNQARRIADLGKFRSGLVKVLVATDVASRGLDIPTVQLVINFDVPRVAQDYVHRVGRTARAGRGGLALTMVSQYDVDIFQGIEDLIQKKLTEFETRESEVLELLNPVTNAKQMAKIHLEEYELKQPTVRRRKDKSSVVDTAASSEDAGSSPPPPAQASAPSSKPQPGAKPSAKRVKT